MPRKKNWKKGRCHKKNVKCQSLNSWSQSVTSRSPSISQSPVSRPLSTSQSLTPGSQKTFKSLSSGFQSTTVDICSEHCSNYCKKSENRIFSSSESCVPRLLGQTLKRSSNWTEKCPLESNQPTDDLLNAASSGSKTVSKISVEGISDKTTCSSSATCDEKIAVQGSFHQGHAKFCENAGKQCVANSCLSMLYDQVKRVSTWSCVDLDRILECGNELYTYVRHSLGIEEMYLLVSELPHTIDVLERTFCIKVGESLTGFVFDNMNGNVECDFVMSIEKALRSTLKTFEACFVTFAMSTFAVIKRNQEFFVFDSHSRSVFGTQIHDGKSVLIKYKCIADVYDHCKKLASSMNISLSTQFEVTGLRVQVIHPQSLTEEKIVDKCCMSENEEVTIVSTEKVDYPFQVLSRCFCTDICSQFGINCEKENLPDLVYAHIIGKPCKTRAIAMDGNCFFRAVSYSISGTESNHRKLRLAVVKHLEGNATSYVSYLRQPFRTVDDYIRESRMKYVSTWATEVEIQATANMLGIDIYTFSTSWLRYSTKVNQHLSSSCGAIYLKLHEQHYEVVLCVEQSDENRRLCTGACYSDFVPCKHQTTTRQPTRSKTAINKKSENKRIIANRKRKTIHHENEEYRNRKRACVREKYAHDQEYKEALKSSSTIRYKQEPKHREYVKTYSVSKYTQDIQHKESVKAYNIEKYRNDLEYKEHMKAYSINKYKTNSEHQEFVKTNSIEKYRSDPEYKEHMKAYSIKKYKTNSEHQEFVKTNNIEKYANNQSFKERAKARSTLRYKTCIKDRQNRKQRNVHGRAQKQNDRKSINTVTSSFNRMKYDAPDHICCVCHRRLFAKQVMNCVRQSYNRRSKTVKHIAQMCITDKYLHICTTKCPQKCIIRHTSVGKLWICFTCHRKIIAGKIPAGAAVNNLQLEPIPDELKCLNSLEQHLIALHIPFSKLMSLPRGSQHGVHGPVVCVPSDIQKTVSVLPRPENDDLMFRVKLKRKLSFKGHVEFKFVNTSRIRNAIRFLKANNKLYADVSFNKEWTNPHCSDIGKSDPDINETMPDLTEKGKPEVETEDVDNGMYMDSCLQPLDIGRRC